MCILFETTELQYLARVITIYKVAPDVSLSGL